MRKRLWVAFVGSLFCAGVVGTAASGCGSAGGTDGGSDPGSAGSGSAAASAGGAAGAASGSGGSGGTGVGSTGGASPFDPDAGCGYAKNQTYREPGALLLVVDQSGSMNEDKNGKKPGDQGYDQASSKWPILTTAVNNALAQVPADASVGLLLFPTNIQGEDWCAPDKSTNVPQIPVGPLSQTGPAIKSLLSPTKNPGGSVTPLAQALKKGLLYVKDLPVKGTKAVLLVTDGAPSLACGMDGNETADYATNAYAQFGLKTFVIGLDGSAETLLSRTAHGGHTDRMTGCNPNCCSDLACSDANKCCHYTAAGAGAAQDLAKALSEVAAQAFTSCVFSVPKGSDPSKYDPNLVNVLVTIDGGTQQLVKKDPADGWQYTSTNADQIVITGPLCDEILKKKSSVEILLGCPTGEVK